MIYHYTLKFKDEFISIPLDLTNNCNPDTFPKNINIDWNVTQFKMQKM